MGKLRDALQCAALATILPSIIFLACIGKARADAFVAPADDGYGFVTSSSAPHDAPLVAFDFQSLEPLAYAASNFETASLDPFEIPTRSEPSRSEPFGLKTAALVRGAIVRKWDGVQVRLSRERKVLARCRADATTCPAAAKRFLAVIDKALDRKGWARIAEINRSINLDIKPVTDVVQYGVVDLWATPLMLFASHAGDCEDYAIAKYVALQEIGVSDDDLRLVIVHDRAANEDHAVAAIRHGGQWLILDNRTLAMRQDIDTAEFEPLFIVDHDGVKRIITSPTETSNVRPAATTAASWF